MKIAYASDLHLEFQDLRLDNTEDADVLVLAGDIIVANSMNHHIYNPFFRHISKQFKHVLYVMGNHEHYHGNLQTTAAKIKEFIFPYPNIHLLDNESVMIDDVKFFGGTLWTSMNDRDPHVMLHVGKFMNDFHIIMNGDKGFSAKDATNEHRKTLEELYLALESNADKVVVVSHHSPSVLSIHPQYKYDTEMNYGYHSRLEGVMAKYPKIKLWIHGHVHDEFDYEVYDTRVVCNPRGYAGAEVRADKFKLKTVEISDDYN